MENAPLNMKKTVKTEIKSAVNKELTQVVEHLKIVKPSKKTRKAIKKTAKALRSDIKSAMKKEIKQATKAPKKSSKSKEAAAA